MANNPTDIIDGKIINWDDMSVDELKSLRASLMEKEKKIRQEIDKELAEEISD